jgi:hypothetical protein
MGHCTKDERQGYFNKIKAKKIELWSLRDTSNGPHCTIEFDIKGKKVLQIKGKQKGGVVKKYIPYVKEFLKSQEKRKIVKNYDPDDLLNIGILEQNGQWYDIFNLPENFTVKGDLDLSDTKIKELPKGLTVGGNLYLCSTPIKELPEDLKVSGDLDLSDTQIKELPQDLKVDGGLYLSDTQIKELPQGLIVNGDLDLSNTPIEYLSEGLTVGRDLCIINTKIKELPEGLTVGRDLYINTKIKTIKRSLLKNVEGSIHKDATTKIVD